jgi:hypothetical protein
MAVTFNTEKVKAEILSEFEKRLDKAAIEVRNKAVDLILEPKSGPKVLA